MPTIFQAIDSELVGQLVPGQPKIGTAVDNQRTFGFKPLKLYQALDYQTALPLFAPDVPKIGTAQDSESVLPLTRVQTFTPLISDTVSVTVGIKKRVIPLKSESISITEDFQRVGGQPVGGGDAADGFVDTTSLSENIQILKQDYFAEEYVAWSETYNGTVVNV